jgi:hypothetical protein
MQNTKLVLLLRTLESKEWERLKDYVYSPFFNKREEVCRLFDYFYDRQEDIDQMCFDKAAISQYVFPDKAPDEKRLAYQYNYLMRLSEDFLAQEDLYQDSFLLEKSKLNVLLEKKLYKHFNFQLGKAQKRIKTEEVRSISYWRDQYWLSEIETQALISERKREYIKGFQNLSDNLDNYFFFEKLRYSCAMANLEAIGANKYDIQFIEQIKDYLEEKTDKDFHIDIYLKIFQCLIQQDNEQTFSLLRQQVEQYQSLISKEELREIIVFVINICLRKTRKGYEEYYEQALDLYMLGIENKTLFTGNNLTHWTYNNVVKLAIRVKRYQWLDQFIDQYSVYLSPSFREEAINYSKAELAFSKQNYDSCLQHINQVNFTDPQYFLGSRIMLLKSFYATDALDALSSQLASFMMFLRRNKKISNDYKQTLLNFCSLLHLILRSRPDKKDKVLQKIEATKQKVEGDWLRQVAEEMMS